MVFVSGGIWREAMMVKVMTMVVMIMVMITTDVRFMRDMARGL